MVRSITHFRCAGNSRRKRRAKPWTAELDKTFAEDPEVAETYGLGSLASAEVHLRRRGTIATINIATKTATTKDGTDFEISQAAFKPTHKRNKGS
jgi:hypothetical protein